MKVRPITPRNALLNKPPVSGIHSLRKSLKQAKHDHPQDKVIPRQYHQNVSRKPITLAKVGGSDG